MTSSTMCVHCRQFESANGWNLLANRSEEYRTGSGKTEGGSQNGSKSGGQRRKQHQDETAPMYVGSSINSPLSKHLALHPADEMLEMGVEEQLVANRVGTPIDTDTMPTSSDVDALKMLWGSVTNGLSWQGWSGCMGGATYCCMNGLDRGIDRGSWRICTSY